MSSAKLSIAALASVAVVAMAGCGVKSGSEITFHPSGLPHHDHPHQQWWSYQFVYHPQAEVYFEPYTRVFFWNEDGEWVEGERLPSHISIDPHLARVVYLKTPVPHAQHITVIASVGRQPYDKHDPSPWPGDDAEFALTQAAAD